MTGKATPIDSTRLGNVSTVDGAPSGQLSAGMSRVAAQGSRIGRFVLLRKLGSGGMGSVFAAYDESIDRKVALKLLRYAPTDSSARKLHTLREARAAARISHPNIISIYEVGETDGDIHIAMEYVDGSTLLEWQTSGERSWREILEMYLQVGEALLAAHGANVVHRDFKPDNVLIGKDGRPRVVDFGLARVGWTDGGVELAEMCGPTDTDAGAPSTGRITRQGVVFGTPGYMSPEQHRGGDIDSRSDQWSFCAALYEALYGCLPFAGSTLREHAESVRRPPRSPPLGTKVPDELRRAIFRGLSPDPDQRFCSMAELLTTLEQELRGGAAAGAASRQRFVRAWLVAVLLALTVVQVRYSQAGGTPRPSGVTWAVLLLVALLWGLWHRQALLSNRFHYHVWVLILVTVGGFFLQRLIGFALDLSVRQLYPFQMIVLASAVTITAATVIRKLFFVSVIPLLACLLSLKTEIPQRVLVLAYPLTALCLVVGWSRAARDQDRDADKTGGGSLFVPRPRLPPAQPAQEGGYDRLLPAHGIVPGQNL